MALASSSHLPNRINDRKKTRTSGWFQVNEYNTLSIISIRQHQTRYWMVFPAISQLNEKYSMAKKTNRMKKHRFDFIYAACFISSQFVSSMQAKCIAKWEWEQRKNNNLTVCLHASIGNERNNNSASMCQQPKTNRQINNETLNNKSNWGVVNWCAAAVAVCKSTWSYLHTHTRGVSLHSGDETLRFDLFCRNFFLRLPFFLLSHVFSFWQYSMHCFRRHEKLKIHQIWQCEHWKPKRTYCADIIHSRKKWQQSQWLWVFVFGK